jgi:hypothetical protein
MNIEELRKPLRADEIEFRVQSVNAYGKCTILAYKDARADMNRLDDVMGALNWKREHSNYNANCTVSLWNDATNQWVSKEDTGSESMAEAKKGLASDSFKRACFNIGIGRELYDYPVIQIKLIGDGKGAEATKFTDEWKSLGGGKATATWVLKLKEWRWHTIFDDAGKLVYLGGKDSNGVMRFTYDIRKKLEKK